MFEPVCLDLSTVGSPKNRFKSGLSRSVPFRFESGLSRSKPV
ncbi:hypothetical protein CP02DC23_1163 [Chlamydia psittaci 02DC23]|nr:hypothetical protein CP02DC23_1163 [Chlamydia psittaci 02DC23]